MRDLQYKRKRHKLLYPLNRRNSAIEIPRRECALSATTAEENRLRSLRAAVKIRGDCIARRRNPAASARRCPATSGARTSDDNNNSGASDLAGDVTDRGREVNVCGCLYRLVDYRARRTIDNITVATGVLTRAVKSDVGTLFTAADGVLAGANNLTLPKQT